MRILILGAKGFIGSRISTLLKRKNIEVLEFDKDNTVDELLSLLKQADYVVHLAGVNRPLTKEEFYQGNFDFTKTLVDLIKDNNLSLPIIMTSSIQAELDNDYGKSKKMAEDYLLSSNLPCYIYRLSNIFGPRSRPNYNTVVATFAYNIAHDLPIKINDGSTIINFTYVDDVCDDIISLIENNKKEGQKEFLSLPTTPCSLDRLTILLKYFKQEVESKRHLPYIYNDFELKLFKTYLYFASDEGYEYNFASDERGSFEELFKSKRFGQISENISFPNITKGGHYHKYKDEIFYVVKGQCEIVQKNIVNDDICIDITKGDEPRLVHIYPMYTHKITNIGEGNSSTLMWISEIYNPKKHDTYKKDC